jgi:hypothetical protein
MPANSETFPWPSYYDNFRFFERQLMAHNRVSSLSASHEPGVYWLELKRGTKLRVFICECYSFGVAEYIEAVTKLGRLDAVVINSAWCGYTSEAKRMCRSEKVGLFKVGDLMRSLHQENFWSYLDDQEQEHFKGQGWL